MFLQTMARVKKECLDAFCCGNKEEVLKLLPKLRSPESIRDSGEGWEGCTLLHHAVYHGWEDVCELLVEQYNCDPTIVSDSGNSPLHIASACGKKASVKYLLSLPSVLRRIKDKDNEGDTPLHLACLYGEFAVIEILLETNSVNITEENNLGLTPVEMLRHYSYNMFIQLADKIDWNTQLLVKSFFNVVLVGNSAAGKSTLAAVMLELTRAPPTQHGRISNVKELTAGMVPTQCKG